MQKSKRGLIFEPVFSNPKTHPFDEKRWELQSVAITEDGGKVIFQQDGVEAPADWSKLATKIAVSKYFHGDIEKGLDPNTGGRETSVRQLIHRVCHTLRTFGERDGYFTDAASAETFERELVWLTVNQFAAFNSPVWFNVGLFQEYGFGNSSGEGNYIYNRETGQPKRPKTQYEYPQGSACFIQKVQDNMESIMSLAVAEAHLFKFGSGTGTDLSTLRSSRERLSGGGRPSGPLSFLRVYDAVARVVKSGGKTRRAAKMNTLNTWHPDIEEFIDCKQLEEKKAWALIEAGYDGSFNGPAYDTISFQNENLSVRASDEFMQKATLDENDPAGLYDTIAVVKKTPLEKKHARTMLRKIAEGTWICGDPGMQFDTTIQKWHTCPGTDAIHCTNPCSEYVFLDDTACNLASLNLLKFRTPDGKFDIERFKQAVRLIITAQEIIVDNASYPTPAIAVNSHIFRTLGLGFANLGALLMSYGLGYDSDEGRSIAACLTSIMTGEAYAQSAAMANVQGAFPGYNDAKSYGLEPKEKDNVAHMQRVMKQHKEASLEIDTQVLVERFGMHFATLMSSEAATAWDRAIERGNKYGYRNAQVTVLAPTGTIGFLMDCDTTGIEPDLGLVKYKTLAGGGMLKIVNQTVRPALVKLGYSDLEITRIEKHIEVYDTIENVGENGGIVKSGLNPEHLPIFDCSFKPANGTRSLGYLAHLKMMAACQPFLSGAISKTVNLPEAATVEDIMNTYIEGWKLGLKAVAIYREGSKKSAPLNTKKNSDMGTASQVMPSTIDEDLEGYQNELIHLRAYVKTLEEAHGQPVRKKMPVERPAITHKFEVGSHKGYITVGLFEDTGKPGEIFIQMNKEGSTIGGLMDTVATLTSMSLQYGVPLESLVKKFAYQRFEPSGITPNKNIRNATSLIDYVFRWLACKFIPGFQEQTSPAKPIEVGKTEETQAVVVKAVPVATGAFESPFLPDPCSNCGSMKVIRTGACGCCQECGTSAGCS